MNDATRALNPTLFAVERVDEPAERTNRSNTGKLFERELEQTAGGYVNRRIATLRKVDPPVAIIWPRDKITGKPTQRVTFKQNPWLDFAGCWIARNGRMLLVEAKSTSSHRLPFKRHGGLTEEQVATIRTWRLSLAAVCVLWRWNDQVTLWTPEMLGEAEARGDKSLLFEAGIPVPRGEGNVIWNFLPVLETALFPANKVDAC